MFEVSMLLVVSLNRLVNAKYENNDYYKILILFYICTTHQWTLATHKSKKHFNCKTTFQYFGQELGTGPEAL